MSLWMLQKNFNKSNPPTQLIRGLNVLNLYEINRQMVGTVQAPALCKLKFSIPYLEAVWPDWAIYWTLGNFSKPLATIILPKSPTFIGIFCISVQISNF